jgi:carbon monoxide dehydrogenase subunit G
MPSALSQLRRFSAAVVCAAGCALMPAPALADQDLEVNVEIVNGEIRADVSLFVRASRQRVWEVINDYERAPEFMRSVQVSKILSRSGETLRVYQKDQVRFGPLTFPLETVKDIRLTEPVRTESRLVRGSIKKYESTTELIVEPGGTRIRYRSVANPGGLLAGFIGESSVRTETEERFKQVRTEILRREYVAGQ